VESASHFWKTRWAERIKERELQVAREMATRTLDDEVSRREWSIRIVQMAMVQLAKAIAEGNVKMTLADLDKLIRLEAFLSDEPDSRQELVFSDLKHKSREEIQEMIKRELEALQELEAKEGKLSTTSKDERPIRDGAN
jgi:hypothetical protein